MGSDLSDSLHYGACALTIFTVKAQVSAYNIANISTNGFKPASVNIGDGYGGKSVQVSAIMKNGRPVQSGDNSQGEHLSKAPSETDLSRDMICLINAQTGFEANAKTIITVDNMLGTLLDIKN